MYACIDLGSNSFHLLIGEWRSGGVEIVERLSEKVQLGEGVGSRGSISAAAFARGLDCLQRFKGLMARYPLRAYWALGTNTLRLGDNAPDFVAGAAAMGLRVSVISGLQEAALIYAGVTGPLPDSDARRLVVDVGGGSTEVVIGRRQKRRVTESLPIGSVAWRDRFFAGQEGMDVAALLRRMEEGRRAAAEVFRSPAAALQRSGWDEVHASSGTVKMLSYVCEGQSTRGEEIKDRGERQLRLTDLHHLKHPMADAIASGAPLPGLKDSRRDLLLAGWCILSGLMETYAIDRLRFSPTALREGMLIYMAKRPRKPSCTWPESLPPPSAVDSAADSR